MNDNLAQPPKSTPCEACIEMVELRDGTLPRHATEAQQADRYRLWQAEHVIHMFREIHGREPETIDELVAWQERAARSRAEEQR